jgi:hypothetical protein
MTPQGDGPFARTVEARIRWARETFSRYKDSLRADGETSSLAVAFNAARRATRRAADLAGIVALCTRCDREQGGSCCGAGIERKYDGWMMLVNLFLGVELPDRRARAGSCYFLGDEGCVLAAREVLCINYLCPTVIEKVPFRTIAALRELEGREIDILFRLNERMKQVIGARGSPGAARVPACEAP